MTRQLLHPRWEELESICRQIEVLKERAHSLREEIDKDLEKYSDEELRKL